MSSTRKHERGFSSAAFKEAECPLTRRDERGSELAARFEKNFKKFGLKREVKQEGASATELEIHKHRMMNVLLQQHSSDWANIINHLPSLRALSASLRLENFDEEIDGIVITKGQLTPSFQNALCQAWHNIPSTYKDIIADAHDKIYVGTTPLQAYPPGVNTEWKTDEAEDRSLFDHVCDACIGGTTIVISQFYLSSHISQSIPFDKSNSKQLFDGTWLLNDTNVDYDVGHEMGHYFSAYCPPSIATNFSDLPGFEKAYQADARDIVACGRKLDHSYYIRNNVNVGREEVFAEGFYLALPKQVSNSALTDNLPPSFEKDWRRSLRWVHVLSKTFCAAYEKGLSPLMIFYDKRLKRDAEKKRVLREGWFNDLRLQEKTTEADIRLWSKYVGPVEATQACKQADWNYMGSALFLASNDEEFYTVRERQNNVDNLIKKIVSGKTRPQLRATRSILRPRMH